MFISLQIIKNKYFQTLIQFIVPKQNLHVRRLFASSHFRNSDYYNDTKLLT